MLQSERQKSGYTAFDDHVFAQDINMFSFTVNFLALKFKHFFVLLMMLVLFLLHYQLAKLRI